MSLFSFLSLLLLFNSYLETLVALTFISPINRKESLGGGDWVQGTMDHDGPQIFFVANFNKVKSPLVIIIHGWRSGSKSMLGRAELYLQEGFHVLIMELPGHGSAEGVSKWNAGLATRNFMHLFDNLGEVYDLDLISKVYLHGHSIGAFISLRFSRESTKFSNSDLIKGYILESPMTCYSEIFNESCRRLHVPHFLIANYWSRLKLHFNIINREFEPITKIEEVDVPFWGIPNRPTLVVQSGNDERLGQVHYERLVQSFTDKKLLTHFLIDDLTHAGARKNDNRDQIIKDWLKNH